MGRTTFPTTVRIVVHPSYTPCGIARIVGTGSSALDLDALARPSQNPPSPDSRLVHPSVLVDPQPGANVGTPGPEQLVAHPSRPTNLVRALVRRIRKSLPEYDEDAVEKQGC